MTLTEFLLARIAEDEQRARDVAYAWLADGWPHVDDDYEWELTMIEGWLDPARPATPPAFRRFANRSEQDLRWFASHYADHPDYDEAWRP
jgi:hypothetical protein